LINLPQKGAAGANLIKFLINVRYRVFIILFLLGAWACAPTQSEVRQTAPAPKIEDRNTEARLRERAQAYWETRKNNDVEAQYNLESVSVTKKVSLVQFIRKKPVADVLSFELGVARLDPGKGEARIPVKVTVVYKLPGMGKKPVVTTLSDGWVFLDGDWYHHL
jgi:hypothetical protein